MTAPTEGAPLPAQSRISSRSDGNELIITIPRGSTASRGCVPTGFTAAFAFLGVTFTAQGLLTRKTSWSFFGLLFFLLMGLQLMLRFSRGMNSAGSTMLRITPEMLTMTTNTRRQWPRSTITAVKADPPSLHLYISGQLAPEMILSNLDPDELQWIAGQINRKWNFPPPV
jgi:hypothetical protein